MYILFFSKISIPLPFIEQCLQYLLLGITQGLTEFLPISSTAHVAAIPFLLGWDDPGLSVTATLQLGSMVAVIAYFYRDLLKLLNSISKVFLNEHTLNENTTLGFSVLLGSLPIIIVGMFFKIFWKAHENSFFRSIPAIAIVSIFMGLLLCFAEYFSNRSKSISELKVSDGILIGFFQALALFPGVSRSGITITAGLLTGYKRQSAAKFSFLLGIPAISLAGLVEFKEAFGSFYISEVIPLMLGISASLVTSWLAIDFLMSFLQKQSTMVFVVYRILFGTLLLLTYFSSVN